MQFPNFFEKDEAILSSLLLNKTMTTVSDAILTTIIEVEPGKKPDKKTSNSIR